MSARDDLRIGYIPFELFHTYWAICLHGVKVRANELGITLVLPSTSPDDDLAAAVSELLSQRLDAVIVPGNLLVYTSPVARFNAAAVPVIIAEFGPDPSYACAVHTNEAQGADMVVEELARRMGKCGKLAHLPGGPAIRY